MKTLEEVLKSLVDVNYTAADKDKAIETCKAVRKSIINGDDQYNFKVEWQEGLTERFLWGPEKKTTGSFFITKSLADDIDYFFGLTYKNVKGYDYSHLKTRALRITAYNLLDQTRAIENDLILANLIRIKKAIEKDLIELKKVDPGILLIPLHFGRSMDAKEPISGPIKDFNKKIEELKNDKSIGRPPKVKFKHRDGLTTISSTYMIENIIHHSYTINSLLVGNMIEVYESYRDDLESSIAFNRKSFQDNHREDIGKTKFQNYKMMNEFQFTDSMHDLLFYEYKPTKTKKNIISANKAFELIGLVGLASLIIKFDIDLYPKDKLESGQKKTLHDRIRRILDLNHKRPKVDEKSLENFLKPSESRTNSDE